MSYSFLFTRSDSINDALRIAILIFVLVSTASFSFSQVFIHGKVSDRQQILPSATVLLLKQDSVVVKGSITNSSGEYSFEKVNSGVYRISASMVGYSKYISPVITIENENVTLPAILLDEAIKELSEIVVRSEKPIFEQLSDRLVVNVQSSITSSGNTVLEILQKSPGVVLNRQNNSLSMNGKSGVRIMLNGKRMELPLDAVVQMLDGMNSSNIEKIELITSPPAKYDADGNAGLINIVTKGNEGLGTNGSLGLTLGAHWAETVGGNFSISHRNEKISGFIDYSILRNHNLHIMEMERLSFDNTFVQTTKDNSHRENITTQQNLSAGLEWKLNNKTWVNISTSAYQRNWELSASSNDKNYVTNDSTVNTKMNIHEINTWGSATIGIGLRTKISSKSEVNFSSDYLFYDNNNPSNYDSKVRYEQPNLYETSKIILSKVTPIHILINKVDYQLVLSPSFGIQAGMKAVVSHLDNNVVVQRLNGSVWVTDPAFTSYAGLHEQIGAAYVSSNYETKSHWLVNSGIRYEYTHTLIGSPTNSQLINRKYGYFFPNLLIEKHLSKDKSFLVSYSKRITRPTYNDIAPYVFLWGPNTFSAGNTSLLPAISESIKVGYTKRQWVVSLQFSQSKREISFLQPEKDASDNLIFRSQNLNYLNSLSLTNSYSTVLTSWWEIQSTLISQYQIAETSQLQNRVVHALFGLNFNLTSLIRLPKDFSLEVSGMYQSRSLSGISEFLPLGSLNAGAQKKIGLWGIIRLSMDDILYTNYWRIKTYSPANNLDTYFKYNWHNQFVRLSFTRNFGNNKLKSTKLKSGSEEERARVTN